LYFVFHFVCCPGGVKQTLQRTREVVSLCSPISLAAELGVMRLITYYTQPVNFDLMRKDEMAYKNFKELN